MSSRRNPSSWRQYALVGAVAGIQREGERCVEMCAGLVDPVSLVRDDAEQCPAGEDDLRHVRRGGRVERLGEQPPGRPEVVLSLMGVAPLKELQNPLTLVHTPRLAPDGAAPTGRVGTVGIPHLVSGDIDAAAREVLINCSSVVVIIAVMPWRYVWRRYVRTPGDAWR